MRLWRRLRRPPAAVRARRGGGRPALARLAIGVGFVGVACLAFPIERPSVGEPYVLGAIQKDAVIAPFTFKILKDDAMLRRERAEAEGAVPPVFSVDSTASAEVADRFRVFRDEVLRIRADRELSPLAKKLALGRVEPALSDGAREALLGTAGREDILRVMAGLVEDVLHSGVLPEDAAPAIGTSKTVTVRHGTGEDLKSILELYNAEEVQQLARRRGSQYWGDGGEPGALVELADLIVRPSLRYETEETGKRRLQAREGVADFEGLVLKDERVIDAHERITAAHVERLESLRRAVALRSGQEGSGFSGRTLLGRLLLSVLMTAGFALFLAIEHPKVFADNPKVLLLALYGSLSLASVAVALGLFSLSPYLVPMAAAPILVAMTVNAQLAFPATAALAVLVGALGGLGIPFVLVSIASGYAGIVSVRRLNRRRDFYRSFLAISAVTVFALGGVTLIEGDSARAFLQQGAWGVLAALVSVVFVSFLLPVVEAAFGVATDISLLELADLNRPLLRRMMIEAPGTYHHSMVVGQLAEAAADAVGGDPLLARVMAYYHDIGKIEKPEYFVENLTPGMKNRHERLTPTMSCLILESHVKEGIELARKERLPRALVSAIPEHHGTTLMSFFYHKAQETDETIDEQDYRYPGPVPRSKETAILMLADGVEAASRALADPTPSRIRAVVKQIVDQRGLEDQLDECNLTMGELAQVRESFVRVLTGIFHGRIRYPQPVVLDETAPSRTGGGRGGNGGDLPRKRAEKG